VTVFSLSAAAKACPLNKSRVAQTFTNAQYVSGLYEDVRTYSEDMCQRNFVPESALDGIITFGAVDEINRSYVLGTMSLDEKYSSTVYTDNIADLSAELEKSISATLKDSDIKVAKEQQNGAKSLANDIGSYLLNRMSITYLNSIKTVLNLGTTAAVVSMIVSGIISVALALIVITMGSELYRNVRSISHSLSASALSCFFACGVYGIVHDTKALGLYPLYLNNSVMDFLSSCVNTLLFTGVILLVMSFVTMTQAWRLKSKALDS